MDARAGSNRAVVVSVAQFDPGVSLGNRAGAQKDAKRLHGTLSRRGFEVELHSDLSGDEIYELFVQGNISMEASCGLKDKSPAAGMGSCAGGREHVQPHSSHR